MTYWIRNVSAGDECDVFVGRPSKWGNPFIVNERTDRPAAIAAFRAYIMDRPALMEMARRELRGKTLGCFCAPGPCHADVLSEIANEETERS